MDAQKSHILLNCSQFSSIQIFVQRKGIAAMKPNNTYFLMKFHIFNIYVAFQNILADISAVKVIPILHGMLNNCRHIGFTIGSSVSLGSTISR